MDLKCRWQALLLVVVVVATFAGVALVLGFLLSGEHPLISSATPPPTSKPALFSDTCPLQPLESLVLLRQLCAVFYANGSIVESDEYDIGRCSNRLCSTEEGQCSPSAGGRCCCQAYSQSVLYLGCQEEVGLEEREAVGQCACQTCTDFEVTFVGRVQDGDGEPVVLATVAMDGMLVDISNEIGLFGFTVPASQPSIRLRVTSTGHASFERSYDVIPGETNVVYVTLLEAVVMVIVPPQESFILSVYDLKIVPRENMLEEFVGDAGVLTFPAGFFPRNQRFTFVAVPIDIHSADISSLDSGFRQARRRGSARMPRQVTVVAEEEEEEPLFSACSVGSLDVMAEEGDSIENSGREFVVSTFFVNSSYSSEELGSLRLYLLNQTTQEFFRADAVRNVTAMGGGVVLVEFRTLDVSFPLLYAIAFPETRVCYTVARAFDPSRKNEEVFTAVRAITRGHEGRKVNLAYGTTGSCLAIPCQGALLIEVTDTQEYDPSQSTVDDIEAFILEQTFVFRREILCEEFGLDNSFFGFDLIPSEFPRPQTEPPVDSDLEGPPFCFVNVDVGLCPGTTARILATTPAGDIIQDSVEGSEDLELDVGCGFICGIHQTACVQVSCDTQNNVSATLLPGNGNLEEGSDVCPAIRRIPVRASLRLENEAPLGSANFVFQLLNLTKVYSDELSEDVARRKCELPSSPANIRFQCNPT